jgi:hypothetical protein
MGVIQHEFLRIFDGMNVPRLAAFRSVSGSWPRESRELAVEVQLYCEAPGAWHPLNPRDGGLYKTKLPRARYRELEPYLKRLSQALALATIRHGPWIEWDPASYADRVHRDIAMMVDLLQDEGRGAIDEPTTVESASARSFCQFLGEPLPCGY